MPVETFNYLDSLVTTNPVTSEGIVNGDDHIRGIKSTLKTTFPNITGPVTGTQADLNTVTSWASGGAALLKSAGTFFAGNPTDGFLNTLAGDIDVQLQGNVAATFQRTLGANFFKVNGAIQTTGGITAAGEIKGPGITPIGGGILWYIDALPTDGLWVWANGQIIANANTVCPVLLGLWGNRFGGNGTTTMGVPDHRETVPVGKSTMGGTTARGILSQFTSTLLTTIGGWIGEALHALTVPELASHNHGGSTGTMLSNQSHSHGYTAPANGNGTGTSPNYFSSATTPSTTSATNIDHQHAIGFDGSGVAHNNVQPSTVCNFIIRIG